MLPAGVWSRELLQLRARPALLPLSTLLPLVAALPLLGGNVPAFHAAAAYCALVVFTAAVGAGRRASTLLNEGLLSRIHATPASPYRLFTAAVLVQVALAMVRVLPLLLAVGVRHHAGPVVFGALLTSVVPAVLLAVVVGVAAGVVAHTRGEVPLYAFVALMPGLFACGAFTPGSLMGPWHAAVSVLVPFTGLHHALLAVTSGLPAVAEGPPAWVGWLTGLAWLGVALLALRRRLRRLA